MNRESPARVYLLAGLSAFLAWGQNTDGGDQLRVPDRARTSLFHGEQGKQRTEIHYDPASALVTLKLLAQDPNGYFIPGIRRENFVVYEDGVRQSSVSVDVEHANVTLGLLLEYGGRHVGVNKEMAGAVSSAGRQLLDALGRQDRLAIWAYGDSVTQLASFSDDTGALRRLFFDLKAPDVSETNLYDALILTLNRMTPVTGRKAIILLSSGLDTFSKASAEVAVAAAGQSDSPIYAVSLTPVMQQTIHLQRWDQNPFARIDWANAENKLLKIAQASGGRLYSPPDILNVIPIYDDMMENLKVRYVITYRPSIDRVGTKVHTVRVELANPKTDKPLEIVDADGRPIHANVIIQQSYTTAR